MRHGPWPGLWGCRVPAADRSVPLFVAVAAVHERVLAEHVLDRLTQRFATVEHEQDHLRGIEATVDQIGEQQAG